MSKYDLPSLVGILLFGVFMTCSANGEDLPNFASEFCKKRPGSITSFEKSRKIAESANSFGIGLYKEIAAGEKPDSNLVYSPMSAHLLLAMVADGAAGQTKSEILAALKFPQSELKSFASETGDLIAQLTCPSEYSSLEFTIANGIFKQAGKPFEKPFLQSMKNNFDTKPQDVDFAKSPSNATKEINSWVSQKTAKKIQQLISEQAIKKETVLILVNAVHLKDGWSMTFEESNTKPKDFTNLNGKASKVQMMFRKGEEGDSTYAKFDSFDVAGIETNSKEIDLVVLLPTKKNGLPQLEKNLSPELIKKIFARLERRILHLSIPKFKLSSDITLTEDLKALGMRQMFQPRVADFKPMDGGADLLFASSVLQKAVIEIHEKGIEAAAATAVMMEAGGMPPKPKAPVKFNVDHPFLYLVRHKQTNAILFLGRVAQL